MEVSQPEALPIWAVVLIPIAFFIVFPLFWCFVVWMLSQVGGWARLARRYRSEVEPQGERYDGVFGRVGLSSYRGMLIAHANDDGLFLEPSILFRCGHPRLFLPWSEFRNAKRQRILWFSLVRAQIGEPKVGTVSLDSRLFGKAASRLGLD